ncbi:ELMD3 protein, partial [Bucorvus abyssinicus]|nr:ELMD3 protein [Bucorvus abyssinicus]
ISFTEALQHFQSTDLSECRQKVRATAAGRGHGLAALLCCLFGPPRLRPQLQGERELALAMAQCPLDDGESVHMRILQTIYRQLTGSRLGCPRYGEHWEELGFQGRAGGAKRCWGGSHWSHSRLSGGIQGQRKGFGHRRTTGWLRLEKPLELTFPFCIMSVNITRLVLQALREDRLCRECNRRQQVLAVLNRLYAAAFLQLYRVWKGQRQTLADCDRLLKALELATKKKPRQLLKSLEIYMDR